MKKLSDKHQTPIWNFEFGAHTTQWVKATTDRFEAPNNDASGWIYWHWKRVSEKNRNRWGILMEINSTPNWDKTRKWHKHYVSISEKTLKTRYSSPIQKYCSNN